MLPAPPSAELIALSFEQLGFLDLYVGLKASFELDVRL
jgi:hypothetical protein